MRIQDIETHLESAKNDAIAALNVDVEVAESIGLAEPPDPTMGDRGFPCFALARHLRKAPPLIAEEVADAMRQGLDEDDIIADVSTAGPYVNLTLDQSRLVTLVVEQILNERDAFGAGARRQRHTMIEFSAPNTNKPQHLGHVRNNLIGDSMASILAFGGQEITRVNLINDRGIHICKSMLAYKLFGEGETPQSTAEKGDHFVGRYYVLFNQKLQQEYGQWKKSSAAQERFERWLKDRESQKDGESLADDTETLKATFFDAYADTYFNTDSELGIQARQMLQKWENGDEEVVRLWKKMNEWVITGFDETYDRYGITFDHIYLESELYKFGKEVVQQGLKSGLFEHRDDGAVICDLEKLGLEGEKVVLRSDGTSVYMTQDLGTAIRRLDDHDPDQMIYVVGNEQEYHFDVLFRILAELRPAFQDRLHHLSYGLVELPEGKMKSREGTVVDADDLLDEMTELAHQAIAERYTDLHEKVQTERADVIGLAALKYYVLDFAPRTTVQFDPERSIDFQGRTGPYCLYGYARITSIAERMGGWPELDADQQRQALQSLSTSRELDVIRTLQRWPACVERACDQLNPGRVTEYLFELSSSFSSLYNDPDHRIVDIDGPRRAGLLLLAQAVQNTLRVGLDLLGIPTLEEM